MLFLPAERANVDIDLEGSLPDDFISSQMLDRKIFFFKKKLTGIFFSSLQTTYMKN